MGSTGKSMKLSAFYHPESQWSSLHPMRSVRLLSEKRFNGLGKVTVIKGKDPSDTCIVVCAVYRHAPPARKQDMAAAGHKRPQIMEGGTIEYRALRRPVGGGMPFKNTPVAAVLCDHAGIDGAKACNAYMSILR